MKKISLLLIGLIAMVFSTQIKAQETQELEDLNYFKYVVIPIQFKFQKKDNEYLINSLVKHLLNEQGFETFMDVEDKPKDLKFNNCLALYVDLQSESESFFSLQTELNLIFRDCNNQIIFESEGRSKVKDFKESYHDALYKAFEIFEGSNFYYEYNGKNSYDSSKFEEGEQKSPIKKEPKKETKSFEETVKEKLIGTYSLFNEEYSISKIEAGYILTNTATAEKKAFINVTSNNSLLFNSDTINGTLVINDDGDLEVEYFNNASGKVEKATLYRVE
ncbi:hypothetical protein J9332_33785 [Aquimarina celericrescens]|nr:hypothetical protein [Aquimarina celericrescens]